MTDFNRISFDIEGTGPRKCYNDKIKYMFFCGTEIKCV